MVVFLTTQNGTGHIDKFIRRYGRQYARDLVEVNYADFLRRGRAPRGAAYCFGDRERMTPWQREETHKIWRQLERHPESVRLLNHPLRQLGRYELLRKLHSDGVNRFRVFRLEEISDEIRFPAFVRVENDHLGPRTDLIGTMDELLAEVGRLVLSGCAPEHLMVIEFEDVAEPDSSYKKFGAFRIGDRVICQHMMQGPDWTVKRETVFKTPEMAAASDAYFLENPHSAELMPVFEAAQIEYGRADFGVKDGRIQIWEINDNPMYVQGGTGPRMSIIDKGAHFAEAFRGLTEGLQAGPDIELNAEPLSRRA